jgi:hypothetical protein
MRRAQALQYKHLYLPTPLCRLWISHSSDTDFTATSKAGIISDVQIGKQSPLEKQSFSKVIQFVSGRCLTSIPNHLHFSAGPSDRIKSKVLSPADPLCLTRSYSSRTACVTWNALPPGGTSLGYHQSIFLPPKASRRISVFGRLSQPRNAEGRV